jgi:hypothetical protein
MLQECRFDDTKDIAVVIPDLSVTLDVSLNNLVLKDTGVISEDNGIDSVSQVLGRVYDNFQAQDMQRFYFNGK